MMAIPERGTKAQAYKNAVPGMDQKQVTLRELLLGKKRPLVKEI
jgi:phosphoenolpyruvate-protein kinase (PTS system EI component)